MLAISTHKVAQIILMGHELERAEGELRGFLETPDDRRPEDPDEEIARELFHAMDRAHRGQVDPSGDIDE